MLKKDLKCTCLCSLSCAVPRRLAVYLTELSRRKLCPSRLIDVRICHAFLLVCFCCFSGKHPLDKVSFHTRPDVWKLEIWLCTFCWCVCVYAVVCSDGVIYLLNDFEQETCHNRPVCCTICAILQLLCQHWMCIHKTIILCTCMEVCDWFSFIFIIIRE